MTVHNRKPVVYASRTLILVESMHAQILEELFVVVLACDHFDTYVFYLYKVTAIAHY